MTAYHGLAGKQATYHIVLCKYNITANIGRYWSVDIKQKRFVSQNITI
jgi:hypothetical protein